MPACKKSVYNVCPGVNSLPHVCICCKSLTSQVFLKGSKEMEISARGREVRKYPHRLSAVNPLLVRFEVWGLTSPPPLPSYSWSPRVPFLPSLPVSFVVCKCIFGGSSFGTGWTGIRFKSWLLQGIFFFYSSRTAVRTVVLIHHEFPPGMMLTYVQFRDQGFMEVQLHCHVLSWHRVLEYLNL